MKALADLKRLTETERCRFMFKQPGDLEGKEAEDGVEGASLTGASPVTKAWSNGLDIKFVFIGLEHCGGNVGSTDPRLGNWICLKPLVGDNSCMVEGHAKTRSV